MRIACCLFRGAVDKVGDGFGLGQVEFVVQIGALGKFPGSGLASPRFETSAQQQVEDYRATMALEFHNVLPGEGVGPGKIQGDTGVHHLAGEFAKRTKMGVPGLQWGARQALADLSGRGP